MNAGQVIVVDCQRDCGNELRCAGCGVFSCRLKIEMIEVYKARISQ